MGSTINLLQAITWAGNKIKGEWGGGSGETGKSEIKVYL